MKNKNECNFWKCSNRIGLFLVILFAACFAWYFLRPVEQGLHLKLFKMAYFGFSDMNLVSFILGAVQTYLWAYIAMGVWHLVGCCLKAGSCKK